MKTASEMASWIAKTIENNSPETAAIIIMEEYNCNPYASHPSPMSAEQVDWKFLKQKFYNECTHIDTVDGREINNDITPKDIFNWIKNNLSASTTPSVKADGLVNVKEKQRLEQIIELKEKERQEWANLCIKKEKILEGLIAGYCTVNEYMYDEYGKLILKEISETFLKNATKADRLSDTEVFQALGETILNFPLPSPPKQQL